MEEKVFEICKQIFNVENIDEKTSISNLQTWDSLNHTHLIMALQKSFNCEITAEQGIELTSISAILHFLKNNKSHG